MKTTCPICQKEFEISWAKALAYSLNDEDNPKCDKCIFDNIFSKLDKDFNIKLYNDNGEVKSLETILSELGERYDRLEKESKTYNSSGIFGHKPTERSGIFKEVKR